MTTEEARKLILDVEDPETDHLAGLEFDQHIHVAARTEVIPQNGTEQRQFPDVMTTAERGDPLSVDGNSWAHRKVGKLTQIARAVNPRSARLAPTATRSRLVSAARLGPGG